jgi:hypothetical protein
MIIIQITGGLGNQMFQYALGLRLSLNLKVTLNLDVESYSWDKLRCFELDKVFGIRESLSNAQSKKECKKNHRYPIVARINRRFRGGKFPYYLDPVFKEQSFRFDPNVFRISDNTYISGHFQSELYFKSIANEIRTRFQFVREPNEYYRKLIDKLQGLSAVSVHIRRGDYVVNIESSKFHGNCSIDYYNTALFLMREAINDPIFVFVSDDIEWTKTQFNHIPDTIFVENNQGEAYEDMRIMSLCKHNIIANSSFSWWGAWLNENPEKRVIAPKNWFANQEMQAQTQDLFPSSWIKI